MTHAGKLLRGAGSAMGARVATAALNYGLFWVLARFLDAERLGGFSLLTNVMLVVQLLPLLGLGIPLMRRVATAPQDLAGEVTNAVAFAAPISLCLALAIGFTGPRLYGAELTWPFWFVALSILPTAWTLVAETALIGRDRVGDVARTNFVEAMVRTALSIGCAWLGYGLTGILACFALMRVLAAVLYALNPALPLPRLAHWSRVLQGRNWREVPVFFGIALLAAVVSRLDVFALSYLRGLQEVATYAAASRLYDAAQMVPTVVALVVLPTLSRQFLSARARFRDTLSLTVRIGFMLGLGLALVGAALAQPVIDLLYRPGMAGAGPVLRLLIFAAVLMTIDVVLSSTMLAARAQRHDLHSLAWGLLALSLALLALVPSFGPLGASAAVTIGLAVRVLARLRWAVREFGLPSPWLQLLRLAAACAIGLAAQAWAVPHGSVAALAACAVAYPGGLWVLGALGRRPLAQLRADFALLTNRGTAA